MKLYAKILAAMAALLMLVCPLAGLSESILIDFDGEWRFVRIETADGQHLLPEEVALAHTLVLSRESGTLTTMNMGEEAAYALALRHDDWGGARLMTCDVVFPETGAVLDTWQFMMDAQGRLLRLSFTRDGLLDAVYVFERIPAGQ